MKCIKLIIGIDPGKKGAISIITEYGKYEVFDMPLYPNGEIDGYAIYKCLEKSFALDYDSFCFIEKSQPMPKQGVVSVFNYGAGYGKLLAALEILKIPYQEIRPQKWKKYFSLIKKDKKESVSLAMKLFPDIEYTTKRGRLLDGRAEALLIAEYGKRNLKNNL